MAVSTFAIYQLFGGEILRNSASRLMQSDGMAAELMVCTDSRLNVGFDRWIDMATATRNLHGETTGEGKPVLPVQEKRADRNGGAKPGATKKSTRKQRRDPRWAGKERGYRRGDHRFTWPGEAAAGYPRSLGICYRRRRFGRFNDCDRPRLRDSGGASLSMKPTRRIIFGALRSKSVKFGEQGSLAAKSKQLWQR